MSDDTALAPAGGEGVSTPVTVITPAENTSETLSVTQAARTLRAARKKNEAAPAAQEQTVPSGASEAAADPNELGEQPDAAPVEEQPSGETQDAEPAQEPPIERPRSWTKDEDAEWQSLPRNMQQKIVAREQERDSGLRRSQNEAAEKLKGMSAKEQAVEQARQQYEAGLAALAQTLNTQRLGEFADIKTFEDANKLAVDDPVRWVKFQQHQQMQSAVQQEQSKVQEQQTKEFTEKWSSFANEQDKLFSEKAPEFADKAKAAKTMQAAAGVLRDLGFTETDLDAGWNGKASLSLRDHRVQLLIRDSVRLREMQDAAKKVAAKPVPQVQRPGVAQPRGHAQTETVQALTQKLERSGSLKDAAALLRARRASG